MRHYLMIVVASALLLFAYGCMPKATRNFYYFDYTEVSNRYGVSFTESGAVGFDYIALGTAVVEFQPGVEKQGMTAAERDAEFDQIYAQRDRKVWVKPTSYDVLEMIAQQAKTVGGDYILNLKIVKVGEGMAASGMIVKRLD